MGHELSGWDEWKYHSINKSWNPILNVCVCVLGVAEVYALKYAFKKKSGLLLQVSSPLSNC